jgi:hypothetical protein
MSEFSLYFELGKDHILDYINGYDHILFVVALCALYLLQDWKRVLILVTAFTIGHSITLALSTLNIVSVKSNLIEFLIPLTIFITAVSNLFHKQQTNIKKYVLLNYWFALVFGLVHGLGFSNYLKALLGKDQSIISQLLAFNLGLESGQIIVVALFLGLGYISVNIFKISQRDWKMVISSAIAGMALILLRERIFW